MLITETWLINQIEIITITTPKPILSFGLFTLKGFLVFVREPPPE